MTAIAGTSGAVKVSTNTVAELNEWNGDFQMDTYETTKFGDGFENSIGGVRSGTGTAKGSWYMGDTSGQKALQDAMLGASSVSLTLSVNGTNGYSGTAWVTNVQVKNQVRGLAEVTFNFKFSGTITYA